MSRTKFSVIGLTGSLLIIFVISPKAEANIANENYSNSPSAVTEYQGGLKDFSELALLEEERGAEALVNAVPIPSAITEYVESLEDTSALAPLNPNKDTRWVSGGRLTFVATGEDTDGRYTLIDLYVPPTGGTRLHYHTRENEFFYILDGTPAFQLGNDTTLTQPGDLVLGSVRRPIHAFRNRTEDPLRMLLLFRPAGIENFFQEFSLPVTEEYTFIQPPYDPQGLVTAGRRYGLEFVSSLEFTAPNYFTNDITSTATVSVSRSGATELPAGGTIALSNGAEIPLNIGVGENYTDVNIPLPEGSSTIDLTLKDPTDRTYIGLLGNRAVIQATPVPESSYPLGLLVFSVLGIGLKIKRKYNS